MDRLDGTCAGRLVVVLVRPARAGNIGAVARVCDNFGVRDLRVVAPEADPRGDEARTIAYHSQAVLDRVRVFENVDEAVADAEIVVGATVRRSAGSVFASGRRVMELVGAGRTVAVLFGPESTGLTGADRRACDRFLRVPTSAACPSLNLSHAVAVTLGALPASRMKSGGPDRADLAPARARRKLLDRMKGVFLEIGYLNRQNPNAVFDEVRLLFGRAELTTREVSLLLGLIRQIEWASGRAGGAVNPRPAEIRRRRDVRPMHKIASRSAGLQRGSDG
ncbi:MAG: hypothetical protein HYR98_02130 [Nitrospirae bacterium]|nr:hypothetical protein [Nitrospirota bacterium]